MASFAYLNLFFKKVVIGYKRISNHVYYHYALFHYDIRNKMP